MKRRLFYQPSISTDISLLLPRAPIQAMLPRLAEKAPEAPLTTCHYTVKPCKMSTKRKMMRQGMNNPGQKLSPSLTLQ